MYCYLIILSTSRFRDQEEGELKYITITSDRVGGNPQNARLAINDYHIVNSSSNVSKYLGIINLWKAESLIDQIDGQAHTFSTRGSTTEMTHNLNIPAETGLPVLVAELDIDSHRNRYN